MFAALLASTALLTPAPAQSRSAVTTDASVSRRNALPLFGAGALALAAAPRVALADDDAIAAIAARANAAAAAEREAKKPKPLRNDEESSFQVGGVLVAGVALSVPFFFKNLQRLGTKVRLPRHFCSSSTASPPA